jgi:hypothetical protein
VRGELGILAQKNHAPESEWHQKIEIPTEKSPLSGAPIFREHRLARAHARRLLNALAPRTSRGLSPMAKVLDLLRSNQPVVHRLQDSPGQLDERLG